jgi:H+-transporting ATPase
MEEETKEEVPEDIIVVLHKPSSSYVLKREATRPRLLNPNDLESEAFSASHPTGVGLTSEEAVARQVRFGLNKLPEKKTSKLYVFCSQLWQPMPIMIWIAIVIEIGIENWEDMAILFFIQFANAGIAFYEISKAGDAVEQLKKSLKAKAVVFRDGLWQTIDQKYVVVGDLVKLASGGAVPADCRLNEGQVDIDQAAMTGESLPVTMFRGDHAKMGSTVVRGETEATVSEIGADTFFGTTAALLDVDDSPYSNIQRLIISLVLVLTTTSVVLCIIVLIYTALVAPFKEALSFTVVLLVASIPLAIEIVTTTTLAVGSKELAHEGAIVTRLAAIEDLAGMSILCSDKTGTLTLNKMVIQEDLITLYSDYSASELLGLAAMASKWNEEPRDALDTMLLASPLLNRASLAAVEQISYSPFDPVVKRTEGTLRDRQTGRVFKTTKGAPHVILQLCAADQVASKIEIDVNSLSLRGIRALAVAKTDSCDDSWTLVGLVTFLDPPRPDTKLTLELAREYGVAVKMITGDHLLIATDMALQLGLGSIVFDASGLPMLDERTKKKPANLARDYGDMCLAADGFAQVFPEHKYLIVECLRELGYKVGMTGDGVNDAPALKRADVGIAVSGATDAARAAADIVLTREGLSTIVDGIVISRRIFSRIRNYLIYRIAATLQLLLFFFIAIFWFRPSTFDPSWPPFFHMPVIMLMLITLLNDGTLIAIGYDNVKPTALPCVWNRPALFLISISLATVALVSSLLLLYLLLALGSGSNAAGISYGQITTSIYLKISISDFLTVFSARTGGGWAWNDPQPSLVLLVAAVFALSMSTVLAIAWPASVIDDVRTEGLGYRRPYELVVYIWLYTLGFWLVQDAAKVAVVHLLSRYNLLNYNDMGKLVLPASALDFQRRSSVSL